MLFPLAVAFGCGPKEPQLPDLGAGDEGPTCAQAAGKYAAVFTLVSTEGSCEGAKAESHDPLEFDDSGQYKPPIDGVVKCDTVQVGCQLAVRCSTGGIDPAHASLDAQVSEDATELHGRGIVEGSYNGCKRVVYDVTAGRKTATAQ